MDFRAGWYWVYKVFHVNYASPLTCGLNCFRCWKQNFQQINLWYMLFLFPRRGNSHRVRPHWTSMHLAFATFLMSNQHVPRAHPTIGTARAARVAFDKSSPQRDGKGPIKCVFLVVGDAMVHAATLWLWKGLPRCTWHWFWLSFHELPILNIGYWNFQPQAEGVNQFQRFVNRNWKCHWFCLPEIFPHPVHMFYAFVSNFYRRHIVVLKNPPFAPCLPRLLAQPSIQWLIFQVRCRWKWRDWVRWVFRHGAGIVEGHRKCECQ